MAALTSSHSICQSLFLSFSRCLFIAIFQFQLFLYFSGSTISPMLRQSTQPPPNVTAPKVAQANPFRTARKEPATVRDV